MPFSVHSFLVHGQDLAVSAFESASHYQHDQHQEHLKNGDSQYGEAGLYPVSCDASGSTHLPQQGFKGVGGGCQPFHQGEGRETEEKRVGGSHQRSRSEDWDPKMLNTLPPGLARWKKGELFLP